MVIALRYRIEGFRSRDLGKGLARRDARVRGRAGSDLMSDEETALEYKFKDGIVVDLSRRIIRQKKHEVHLTSAEGHLLRVLLENAGKVFSHRDLVLLVQGYDTSPQEAPEVLRPLVSRLRHKMADFPDLVNRISSIRGTGYVFEEDGG